MKQNSVQLNKMKGATCTGLEMGIDAGTSSSTVLSFYPSNVNCLKALQL